MRAVKYEVFAQAHIEGDHIDGTVADLLESIPYLLSMGVIPPLPVVNDVLRGGISDAGMSGGCRWDPVEIDAREWDNVRAALEAGGKPYRYIPPPEWVESHEDWHVWLFEHVYGVPADEHRRLQRQDTELKQAIEQALAENDEERVAELHVQRVRVNEEISRLVMTHIRRT
jgi:hypothetical protein